MSVVTIEAFAHLEGAGEDFLGLPGKTEGLNEKQASAEMAGTRALIDPRNTFYSNGSSCNFVAYRDATPVGRLTAFQNLMLHGDQAHYGLVGLFSCENNQETASALVAKAALWLKGKGLTMMRGPMAGDIWHRWRFITRGFDTSPFPGEPRQPDYYPALFTGAGFAPVRTYSTKKITDLPAQLAKLKKPAQFNAKRGVTFRNLDRDNWEAELVTLYQLCRHSFAENWGVTETTQSEFVDIYDRWLKRSGPEQIVFAQDQGGAVVGLGLAMLSPADTINLKTIAILPGQSGFGLGKAIAAELYQRAIDAGLKNARHCLMGPMSPVQRWDQGLGKVTREYTVYERSI